MGTFRCVPCLKHPIFRVNVYIVKLYFTMCRQYNSFEYKSKHTGLRIFIMVVVQQFVAIMLYEREKNPPLIIWILYVAYKERSLYVCHGIHISCLCFVDRHVSINSLLNFLIVFNFFYPIFTFSFSALSLLLFTQARNLCPFPHLSK